MNTLKNLFLQYPDLNMQNRVLLFKLHIQSNVDYLCLGYGNTKNIKTFNHFMAKQRNLLTLRRMKNKTIKLTINQSESLLTTYYQIIPSEERIKVACGAFFYKLIFNTNISDLLYQLKSKFLFEYRINRFNQQKIILMLKKEFNNLSNTCCFIYKNTSLLQNSYNSFTK